MNGFTLVLTYIEILAIFAIAIFDKAWNYHLIKKLEGSRKEQNMKRIEKFTKEEILKTAKRFIDCEKCPVRDDCNGSLDCAEAFEEYMKKEIEMIPRAWTFRTAEEAYISRKDTYEAYCKSVECKECKYFSGGINCNYNWLYEEVAK